LQDNDWYLFDGTVPGGQNGQENHTVWGKGSKDSNSKPSFENGGGAGKKSASHEGRDFFSAMGLVVGFGVVAFVILAIVRRRHQSTAEFANTYGTFDWDPSAPALPPRDYGESENEDDEATALIPSKLRKLSIGWPLERPVPAVRPDKIKGLSRLSSNSQLVEVSLDAPGASTQIVLAGVVPARMKPMPAPRVEIRAAPQIDARESVEVPTGYILFDEQA
jgi:hypothetical protein